MSFHSRENQRQSEEAALAILPLGLKVDDKVPRGGEGALSPDFANAPDLTHAIEIPSSLQKSANDDAIPDIPNFPSDLS